MSSLVAETATNADGQIIACKRPGLFAMTFDDGPYDYSPQVLSSLKRYNVKATFFLVGELVTNPSYIRFVKQMIMEGHQVASHTFTHPHLNSLSDEQLAEEIQKSEDAIYQAIGYRITYFRCPYGECDSRVVGILKGRNYKVVNWNLDTLDWQNRDSNQILSAYNTNLDSASSQTASWIALEHEIVPQTVSVLPQLIRKVRSTGYRFVTVANCI
ncbi:carbohydrate esterase family 4 protein [Conidiobolus coronatus NRRL 28638]|uniref:Carbohydrate esterase family 4 protein n=1 Tax=Conidiobolus coronatus (strain ATCC 28846 / CBS 209.66 / NRRL 28638) TaxID=796925 RepID=A0A137NYN9_CONC2|nr:carbohydrate esterase family 4 protein [Conidiobolus coronatus NRRL 28638]|eukprot:KXN67764.1 carbohydrate esterase family 4 protein [Conidiobolus coronatus NRRL 28638]